MMDLCELDELEIRSHTFEQCHLEKVYDWWEAQFAIDGQLRQKTIIPHQHVVDRGLRSGTEAFENFIKAQCIGSPLETRHG